MTLNDVMAITLCYFTEFLALPIAVANENLTNNQPATTWKRCTHRM